MPEDPGGWADFTAWMSILDGALRVEGLSTATAERILNRIMCGGPDPERIYRHEPIPADAATKFLFVWLDTVLGGGPGAGRCLKCREPITAITTGRRDEQRAPAWFQIDPCGHLFETEPPTRSATARIPLAALNSADPNSSAIHESGGSGVTLASTP